MKKYLNFEIRIEREGDRYVAGIVYTEFSQNPPNHKPRAALR